MKIKNLTDLDILEKKVLDLLQTHARGEYSKNEIAPYVAKKSLLMNHLYEDLGLRNRFEMGHYMSKYFPSLAKDKPSDKLWKKYIYDTIEEIAPACEECNHQESCFACMVKIA